MKMTFKKLALAALAVSVSLPFNANATNGYFLIGFGSKSRAMGGVGVAKNMDGLAAAFNPASLSDSDTKFDIAAELFRPKMGIRHDSGLMGKTDEQSNHDLFLIPAMGGSYKWDNKITLGAAIIGAGMKTEFAQNANNNACSTLAVTSPATACPPTVFNILNNFAATEAGIELYQIQMLPSIAYNITDDHSVGATLVMAIQYFRSEGLEDFGSANFTTGGPAATLAEAQDGLTGREFSHSSGAGIRLGYLGRFMDDKLRIGLNYSPEVSMSRFEKYQKLFAEGGKFNIPENYAIGINVAVTKDINISFDVQQINYSDIPSVGNPGPNAADPNDINPLCPGVDTNDCKLGGNLGMGFGWTDQTAYKFGIEWQHSDKLAFRGGLNYGEATIPNDQVLFNLLAPATIEMHFTVGAEYAFSPDYVLSVNWMHGFQNTIEGPTAFGPGGAVVSGNNAAISMYQDSLGATLSVRF